MTDDPTLDRLIGLLRETTDPDAAADLVDGREDAQFLLDVWEANRAEIAAAEQPALNPQAFSSTTLPEALAAALAGGETTEPRIYNAVVNRHVWYWLPGAFESIPEPDPRWPGHFVFPSDLNSAFAHFVAGGIASGALTGRVWDFGKYFEIEAQAMQRIRRLLQSIHTAFRGF